MTNPDNIVRVRARNGGRASVLEANGWCQMLSTGLLDGKGVVQNTVADLNVLVGGTPAKPDVVIAQTPSGYKVALDIVGQQPIQLTKPGSGKRYVAIVAYTDDLSLSTEETNVTGSPSTCGLIPVNSTGSQLPTDSEIRSAITTDGATGSQAAYGILATVEVDYQATAITDSLITVKKAGVMSQNVDFTTYRAGVDWVVGEWIDGRKIYRRVLYKPSFPMTQMDQHYTFDTLSNFALPVRYSLWVSNSDKTYWHAINGNGNYSFGLAVENNGKIDITPHNETWSNPSVILVIDYVKNS